jgi:hypothetical protein
VGLMRGYCSVHPLLFFAVVNGRMERPTGRSGQISLNLQDLGLVQDYQPKSVNLWRVCDLYGDTTCRVGLLILLLGIAVRVSKRSGSKRKIQGIVTKAFNILIGFFEEVRFNFEVYVK